MRPAAWPAAYAACRAAALTSLAAAFAWPVAVRASRRGIHDGGFIARLAPLTCLALVLTLFVAQGNRRQGSRTLSRVSV